MAKVTYVVGATNDGEEGVIELRDGEKVLGHIQLSSSDLDALIDTLGVVRSKLNDKVPPSLDTNVRLVGQDRPAWQVATNVPGSNRVVLAIRHPGFGWLGFFFEPTSARHIAECLTAPPDAPPWRGDKIL